MSIATRRGQGRRMPALARLAALAASLCGLFVMHGLGDHGTAGQFEPAAVTEWHSHLSSAAAAPVHALRTAAADVGIPRMADGGAPRHPTGGHESGTGHGVDHGLGGLCLAILLAVAWGRLAPFRAAWAWWSAWFSPSAPAARRSGSVATRARAPNQMDLILLSVQRC
ncbi:MAG: hypothetical protein ACRCYQ_16665 [Nocardioides sp.]